MSAERHNDSPVLIAYDGSDYAKAAIAEAGRELEQGRRAIVLTVWQPLSSFPILAGPTGLIPAEYLDEVESRAREVAGEGAGLARGAGFEAEPMTVQGSPTWTEVLKVADETDAGLIVIGSHGRTGLEFVALGSVATAVSQHSKRPVMISKKESP